MCVYRERDREREREYRERETGSHSHGGNRRRLVLKKPRVAFVGLKVHLEVIQRFALREVRVRLRTQDA